MNNPTEETLKLKRQLRDYYNKQVNDQATLLRVALAINYPYLKKENESCPKK